MSIRTNAKVIEERMMKRLQKFLPDSEKKQAIMHRIGQLLTIDAQLRAERQRIYDTGALINSIRYEIDGDILRFGSFGVPYAKYHEFGTKPFSERGRRAMFAAMRERQKSAQSAKRYKKGGKKVFVNNRIRPRPFIRPAIQSKVGTIRKILAEYGAL